MKSLLILFMKALIAMIVVCAIIFFIFEGRLILSDVKDVLIFPLTLCVALSILHYAIARASGVTDDFSPYQQSVVHDIDLDHAKQILSEKTNWKLVNETDDSLIFKTGMQSIKSYGETIQITKQGNALSISSKPSVVTTLFDMGQNFQNVRKIENLLAEALK